MIIGFCAAGLATVVSVALGIVTGYLGGKLDLITQRFVDAWMSFPDLIILIVVVAVVGPGMPQIIVTLGLLLGIGGSRIIRSAVVSVRENMYVHAAQSVGASTWRILWRHILPNVMPPIIVLFTTRVGTVILAESGLVPRAGRAAAGADLGGMLSGTGRTYMFQGPWLALAPGLCLTAVVYATNVFGDALRDLLDPRMRGSRRGIDDKRTTTSQHKERTMRNARLLAGLTALWLGTAAAWAQAEKPHMAARSRS